MWGSCIYDFRVTNVKLSVTSVPFAQVPDKMKPCVRRRGNPSSEPRKHQRFKLNLTIGHNQFTNSECFFYLFSYIGSEVSCDPFHRLHLTLQIPVELSHAINQQINQLIN